MTRVRSLSPALAGPAVRAEVEVLVDELAQTETVGERGRQEEARVGLRRIAGDVRSVRLDGIADESGKREDDGALAGGSCIDTMSAAPRRSP